MKNKLTTVLTYVCVIIAICSAFFGTPGDTEDSVYDNLPTETASVTESTSAD